MRQPLRRTALFTGASALALGLSTLAGLPSAFAEYAPPALYASGLTNPRGISVGPDGALYVAEAGTGGDPAVDTCGPGPEGAPACLNLSGAVVRITDEGVDDVLSGLPSLGGAAGIIGPQDVVFEHGGNFAVSMGAGIEAENRDDTFQEPMLGTVYSGRIDRHGDVKRARLTDLAAFEAAHNPDDSDMHDSDPSGLVANGGSYVVADAGGNTLLHATRGGHVSVIATFPQGVNGPPFMQAVPTAVAVGPDGAYYVSELTGAPFPVGGAVIWRVVPGEQPEVWASGLSAVTDLAWDGDQLYAVEMFSDGFFNSPGALVAVHADANDPTTQTVGPPLPAPYGVAIKDGTAYVTINSLAAPGAGAVAEIPLG